MFNTTMWQAMAKSPLDGGISIEDVWDLEEVRLVERLNMMELQRVMNSIRRKLVECPKCGKLDGTGSHVCLGCRWVIREPSKGNR